MTQPEIIGRERIPTDQLQALTLDDVAVILGELLALTKRQMPEGRTPVIRFTDQDPITTDWRQVVVDPPWFSVDIFNDGAVVLLFALNNVNEGPVPIFPGEEQRFPFDLPIIETIYLRTESGSAPVRLVGTR